MALVARSVCQKINAVVGAASAEGLGLRHRHSSWRFRAYSTSSSAPIVVVTGASRGIGLAFAKEFLNKKYKVVATCRNPAAAEGLLQLKQGQKQLHILQVDVTDPKSLGDAAAAVANHPDLGHVDILVNNAGIATKRHPREKIMEIDPEEFVHLYRVNVAGPLVTLQQFRELLKKSPHGAKVANVSSIMGSISGNTFGNVAAYRCSKTALNALTKTEAFDLKEFKFIALHPGWVQTAMGNAGGRKAEITPEESVKGMVQVIESLKTEDSGKFVDYKGQPIAY